MAWVDFQSELIKSRADHANILQFHPLDCCLFLSLEHTHTSRSDKNIDTQEKHTYILHLHTVYQTGSLAGSSSQDSVVSVKLICVLAFCRSELLWSVEVKECEC